MKCSEIYNYPLLPSLNRVYPFFPALTCSYPLMTPLTGSYPLLPGLTSSYQLFPALILFNPLLPPQQFIATLFCFYLFLPFLTHSSTFLQAKPYLSEPNWPALSCSDLLFPYLTLSYLTHMCSIFAYSLFALLINPLPKYPNITHSYML